MFTIDKINITQYGQSTVTLSNDLGTGEMTLRLSVDQANEVEKLVREMLATAMRMPIIKEKLEAAKAISPIAPSVFPPPPAVIDTPNGPANFTPDGYKPEEAIGSGYCTTHGRFHGPFRCPDCAKDSLPDAEPDVGPDVEF